MTDSNAEHGQGTYRAFCAYDHRGRAPGCGWQRFVDDEAEAKRLAEKHSESHHADYERRAQKRLVADGGADSGRANPHDARSAFNDLRVALSLIEQAGEQLPNQYQDRAASLHSDVDDLAAEVWSEEVDDDA